MTSTQEPVDLGWWQTVQMFGRQLGLAGDLYLSVVGSGLLALSFVVFLDGFGIIEKELAEGTGTTLGVGLVLAVLGFFALGIASEGPLTGMAYAYPELHLAASRAIGVAVVSVLGLVAAAILEPAAARVAPPLELAVVLLRGAAFGGLVFVLPVAVPGAWWLRREFPMIRVGWDRLIFLAAWTATTWIVVGSSLRP
ncbi:MAG: hypothetical protein HKN46_08365 [Acidimicrobiia bacterium]|nr:hypothetical protein [Acidimicrobiia bacterium]